MKSAVRVESDQSSLEDDDELLGGEELPPRSSGGCWGGGGSGSGFGFASPRGLRFARPGLDGKTNMFLKLH